MSKLGTRVYRLEFKKPRGASDADVREFIIAALETWGGQRHPSDPLFHSLREGLKVTRNRDAEFFLSKRKDAT